VVRLDQFSAVRDRRGVHQVFRHDAAIPAGPGGEPAFTARG
jgi:hypothetical protein